jgi:glycosyltransferase involved in cell wall biosynthesis
MNKKKIVIVTTGQPSTNPRMVKEYWALKKAGYNVKVLYSFWAFWAIDTDAALFCKKQIEENDFILVGGSPDNKKQLYFLSRLMHKAFRLLSYKLSLSFFDKWAISRPTYWLEKAAKKEKADLYIGHNLGALPAVVLASKKWETRCGFDAEDYHRGGFKDLQQNEYRVTCKVEETYMPACHFVTAASPLIGEAYLNNLKLPEVVTINNVFSISNLQTLHDEPVVNNELRLFWFSQTLGPDRGLEAVVAALEILKDHNIKFTLLGSCSVDYRNKLLKQLSNPQVLEFIDPVGPDEIFSIAAKAHVGVAAEVIAEENRNLCLVNKLFTYLLAGNCVLASNTKAQKKFLEDYPGIGLLYTINDPESIADQLRILYNDRNLLNKLRRSALDLGKSSLNWEQESKKLVALIDKLLMN